jgi:hypothetical protein
MTAKQIAELANLATASGASLTLRGDRVVRFAAIGADLAVTFRAGYTCLLKPSDAEFRSIVRQIHWFAKGVAA